MCSLFSFRVLYLYIASRLWNSVVGIAAGYGLDDRGVGVRVPVGSRMFSPTGSGVQPIPIQWIPETLTPGGDHSPPASAKVKKMRTCTSTPPYALMGWLVYSCCSHFKHRASVKRFVSFKLLNIGHSVGLLGRVISPPQGHYLFF
jgi:hypothetical protein